MYPRGHRGFGALLMRVLLLVSGLAVLPWNASAQGNQIVGLVYQCGSPATFIGGATVTLTDPKGGLAPQTATVGGGAPLPAALRQGERPAGARGCRARSPPGSPPRRCRARGS